MPTLEERVAYLEGKVEELSGGYTQLRQDIHALDQKVDRFREELSGRIHALDQKVDRFREELAGYVHALDQKFSRWFAWLAGFLITALLAQLGLLGAALFRR
jgi:predicted  nucleic acid-binding Zn-ribbon protein